MQHLPQFTTIRIQLLVKKGKGRHLIYNTTVVNHTKFQIIHHIEAS